MFEREEDARKKAEEVKDQLPGKGWKIHVWENIGWHYRVIRGPVRVSSNYIGTYGASVEGPVWDSSSRCGYGLTVHGPDRSTPMKAMKAAIKKFKNQVKKVLEYSKKVDVIAEDY
jgi:hypothetical protein